MPSSAVPPPHKQGRSPGRTLVWATVLSGATALPLIAALAWVQHEVARAVLIGLSGALTALHVGVSIQRARAAGLGWVTALALSLSLLLAGVVVVGGAAFFDALFVLLAVVLPAHIAVQSARSAAISAVHIAAPVRRGRLTAAVGFAALSSTVALMSGPRDVFALRGLWSIERGLFAWAVLASIAVLLALVATRGRAARAVVALVVGLPAAVAGLPLCLGTPLVADWLLLGPPACVHAAQLIALAIRAEPRVARLQDKTFDGLAWFAVALVLGIGLTASLPVVAARLSGSDPTTVLLAVSGVVALAHALVDLRAWSLSDATLLRAATDTIAPAPSGRHLTSNLRAALFTVIGGSVVSLALFDPMQSALVRSTAEERDLLLAALIFPADARLAARDARTALANDELEVAQGALDGAARAVSGDIERLRLVVCTRKNPDAAADCFDKLPPQLTDDFEVAALHVTTLLRLGRLPDARAVAERAHASAGGGKAAAVLPGLVQAVAGDAGARDVLRAALDARQADIGVDPAAVDPLYARAAAHLARIERRGGRRDEARALAERAERGAVTNDDADVAVMAFSEEARLATASGDYQKALQAWQVTLQAADDADEPVEELAAWVDYEGLLETSGATPRQRYICVQNARAALEAVPAGHPERTRYTTEIAAVEARLVPFLDAEEMASIREDLGSATAGVLTLAYPTPDAGPAGLVDDAGPDNNQQQ